MLIKKGKVKWTHLFQPTDKELESLRKEYGFHPIIIDELRNPSARSKVEIYGNYMFIVYHLPIFDRGEMVSKKGEVDFLITKDSVISVVYQSLEPIETIEKKIDADTHYKERVLGGDTARLLYYLIETCLIFSLRQLRHIDEKIEDVRNEIFKNREKEMLKRISYIKRDLLSYYLITKSQISIFNSLNKVGNDFFGEKSKIYFSDLEGDFLKILQLCENYKETVEAFENTNSQLLTIKTNEVVQRFSVLAFMTFPLMVVLALLAIDTHSRPLIGKTPNDFWILAGIILILAVTMGVIFKRKKWL
ncbi:MAG: Mg2 transporter protein CorA family protein [Candidatus Wolfebacteria bacterium GW2011_GWC1_43_10]|uniref:Mg2 transporter protein CorA family protein n=1 Tax=Candidatus Wolfebacteria bacterium GW2011_GWC1_43_10 TaxID=1619011 RepID=A0A0G1C8H9_9BACT|nr:MAG: Mg2 transporter protein CorA family protein [Candidatus Wolfebacteria bacterium GW2011_GWC1_43_10]KKT22808.1 MAG: Mg2 transporter protein CorA family protein [Parcubacteria group bacterium GW2011_GWB1_43_8b]